MTGKSLRRWAPYALGLVLGGGSVAAWPAGSETSTAAYPTRPIRIIVPTSPSGGVDFVARIMGQNLGEASGQTVVVDNRPGATGLIGMGMTASATPDGYTLLVISVSHFIAALLHKGTFDFRKDLLPTSLLATTPEMLAVNPSLPARSLAEFIALAKSRPGKINYASGGVGGIQHLTAELLKREAGIDLVHVPYKGTGPGLVDLLAGQVQLTITSVPSLMPYVTSGRLRALAVTGKARLSSAPGIPTFAEAGLPGVNTGIWFGLLAPANTPRPIVDEVWHRIARIAKMPAVREVMSRSGVDAVGSSPAEFAMQLRGERERWLEITRQLGLLKE